MASIPTVNDTFKAWLHTNTGTTPGQNFTINDLMALLDSTTGPIVVSFVDGTSRFEIRVNDGGMLSSLGPL